MIGLIGLISLIGAATGCGKGSKDNDKDPVKKDPPEESKTLRTSAGTATVRDPEGDRPILYVINWEESQLDYTLEKGASAGALQRVSGELYRDGKLASRFTADRATADKDKHLLVLVGNVVVNGIDPKAQLKCQKMEWFTNRKLLRATGKVTVELEPGTVGPNDEYQCYPDLQQVGTPGSLP